MDYEYKVKTEGMSMLNSIEDLGNYLEAMLNREGGVPREPGWELFYVQVLSDVQIGGNNGLICVFRRPKA